MEARPLREHIVHYHQLQQTELFVFELSWDSCLT